MNWEVILWTCITIGFLLVIAGIIITIISMSNFKKRKESLTQVHETLKKGARVIFCGGIYGTVENIDGDIVEIEIAKGTNLKVSRYSIQSIEN